MDFKHIMKQETYVKIQAWVILELWNVLHEIERTNSYTSEDIKELRSIIDKKVDLIQNAANYQKEHFGRSKYDL